MVIPAIDQRGVDRCSFECLGGGKAAESAPDDDDMWGLHDVPEGGGPDSYVEPHTRHYLDAARGR